MRGSILNLTCAFLVTKNKKCDTHSQHFNDQNIISRIKKPIHSQTDENQAFSFNIFRERSETKQPLIKN